MNARALSFLNKVTNTKIGERCFPGGFDKHSKSNYIVQMTDLKSDIGNLIRPMFDQPCIEKLSDKNTFTSEVCDYICSLRNNKFAKAGKRKFIEVASESESEEVCSEKLDLNLKCLYVPIDPVHVDMNSSVEDDIFDFIEVVTGEQKE